LLGSAFPVGWALAGVTSSRPQRLRWFHSLLIEKIGIFGIFKRITEPYDEKRAELNKAPNKAFSTRSGFWDGFQAPRGAQQASDTANREERKWRRSSMAGRPPFQNQPGEEERPRNATGLPASRAFGRWRAPASFPPYPGRSGLIALFWKAAQADLALSHSRHLYVVRRRSNRIFL